MEAVFESYDADADGRLSTEELLELLFSLNVNVSNEEAMSVIKTFDTDNDGELNFQEFLLLFAQLKNMVDYMSGANPPDM